MKKVFAIVMSVALLLALMPGVALADPDKRGNDLPKGKSFNFNVIGVNDPRDVDWTGGEGKRIFVLRTGTTWFWVHGGDSFEILDRNGTDGDVGWDRLNPGLILPYVGTLGDGEWKCEIYVRLVGPIDSSVKFKTYVWDGSAYIHLGGMEFTQNKGTKFMCRTNKLLADNYQDILWEMNQKNKFRNMQWRIFVEPTS